MTRAQRNRTSFSSLALAAVLLAGCPEPPPDGDGDADADADPDEDGDGDADAPPARGLSGTVEAPADARGAVILELTPARPGSTIYRYTFALGEPIAIGAAPTGPNGLRAWVDEDRDGQWDGTWAGDGEPTAQMGVTVPRHDLAIVLRRGVPEPVIDGAPGWVALNEAAWRLAEDHVAAGTAANGFSHHYMDEAFSDQIFQWDTCFMTLFGRYGADAFPVMESLDNFYGVQRDDGFICRVVDEDDGEPCTPTDPSEPMINPPLFGWVELRWAEQTGDLSRLPRVLPVLEAYHAWLDEGVRTGAGLYYTSMLGSGMDNAPRDAAYDGWVDVTAQQALGRRVLARLHELLGEDEDAARNEAEAERICGDIGDAMWDEAEGFFFDVGWGGARLTDKTLASIWPLLAGCATPEQTARVVAHLRDPSEFWRLHVFPSTAADSPAFEPDGHYWRGGVWAPTNYATIAALDQAGYVDLARAAAENHLRNLEQVYDGFAPDPAQLDPEAVGDGRETLWELYAPDAVSPGTRWDDTYLGRQDFVGWTGLGPIALLVEQVIGLRADALADRLTWRVARTDRHGVRDYRFGDQLVDVVARERAGVDSPIVIDVSTSDAFTLVVEVGELSQIFEVPRGNTTLEVDPTGAALPADLVPAGSYPGYAVLGNGSLTAVYSDDAVASPPPGIAHLYWRSFGLDLVESGRTIVAADGEEVTDGRVGLDPFFAAYAERRLPGGGWVIWRTFAGEGDAVVFEGALVAAGEPAAARVVPYVRVRAEPHIDGAVTLSELGSVDAALVAQYSDGTAMAVGCVPPAVAVEAGDVDEASLPSTGPDGSIDFGTELALAIDLEAGPGEVVPFRWVVAAGSSPATAASEVAEALADPDPLAAALVRNAAMAPERLCEIVTDRCRVAAANLAAARASGIDGVLPADLTGQFVTNDFPQLYPRDALMVARAFHLAGLDAAAPPTLSDWLTADREGPAPGEWYARYDALGRAVDGGSGARYDVPEWDSNGYLAALVEQTGPDALDAAGRSVVLEALDALVARQDDDGLFTEGGIVEWVGRLPGTAMTSWVGLDAGARLARRWGDDRRASTYREAAGRIHGGLAELFDLERLVLADEREGRLDYDSSLLFGPAWGYPPGPLVDASYRWFLDEATAFGGGVRYFEGNDYGQDLFFFTTSAAAQYAVTTGRLGDADRLVDWMVAMTNRYGLAPERIYDDGSGSSEASPLSWCAAELGATLLLVDAARGAPAAPVVDGDVRPAEYLATGAIAVDTDREPDGPASPVALLAAHDGDELVLGLTLAGEVDELGSAEVLFYIASEAGAGPGSRTAGGEPLTFATSPELTPGAEARVTIDLALAACSVGPATGGDETPCLEVAVGARGLEARVDLATTGLSAPVQIIAVSVDGGEEALLPPHGALSTGPPPDDVLVTFEVDASSIAPPLGPGEVVTLSGDRPELGAWAGHAIALRDDGVGGDAVARDELWTAIVRVAGRGRVEYKYLVGTPGDPSWAGVEFAGANRTAWIQDADRTGRVRIRDVYAVRGGALLDL